MTEIYQGYWSVEFNARKFLLERYGTIATNDAYLRAIAIHKIDGLTHIQETYLAIAGVLFLVIAEGRKEKILRLSSKDFTDHINKAVSNLIA
jgi:hypothetical protein